MKRVDFLELHNFDLEQVVNTGASIEDVKFITMATLQKVRDFLGFPITLIRNGLTTGKHSSKLHQQGLAVDFRVIGEHKPMEVVFSMVKAGFHGIGVYLWADGHYTYHGDMRSEYGSWFRITDKHGNSEDISIFSDRMV